MQILRLWKSILASVVVIFIVFFFVSVFDIILAVLSNRFYSTAAFITIFCVGGIFAALFSYSYGIDLAKEKNEWARWSITSTIILTGILFFFLLARLEGGEYEPAFKAFGATLIPAGLFFGKMKIDL